MTEPKMATSPCEPSLAAPEHPNGDEPGYEVDTRRLPNGGTDWAWAPEDARQAWLAHEIDDDALRSAAIHEQAKYWRSHEACVGYSLGRAPGDES